MLFKKIDSTIRTFDTPEAVLAVINNETPDIVFSDYHFDNGSKLTGIDLLLQVKAIHPSTKLFLMSNISNERGMQLVHEHSLSGFFPPMIPENELAVALKEYYQIVCEEEGP